MQDGTERQPHTRKRKHWRAAVFATQATATRCQPLSYRKYTVKTCTCYRIFTWIHCWLLLKSNAALTKSRKRMSEAERWKQNVGRELRTRALDMNFGDERWEWNFAIWHHYMQTTYHPARWTPAAVCKARIGKEYIYSIMYKICSLNWRSTCTFNKTKNNNV